MGVLHGAGKGFFRARVTAFLTFVTVGLVSEALSAASLEVSGKTFIGKSCTISGDAQFNTSRSLGAAISMNAATSCATFAGPGEITIYGDPGIEITGAGEPALVFHTLPNFRDLDGQTASNAIYGNNVTTVRFEDVRGVMHGNAAAGLFVGDDADVTIYGENLLQAPVEGKIQFSARGGMQPGELGGSIRDEEELAPEIGPIEVEEDISADSESMLESLACLQRMRSILLQTAPVRKSTVFMEKFKATKSNYGSIFLAYCHALKNTPTSILGLVGHTKSSSCVGQNCCGICCANVLECSAWDVYGLWSENYNRIHSPNRNGRDRIACVGCAQGCSPWHINCGHYTIRPIFGLGAEHQVVRKSLRDEDVGKADLSGTMANLTLSLDAFDDARKINFTARVGVWRPIHGSLKKFNCQQSTGKPRFYDICCTRCFRYKLKGKLVLTKPSQRSEFYWSAALIYNLP